MFNYFIAAHTAATGRTVFDSNKLTRFEWLAADSALAESRRSILRMSFFTYELRSLAIRSLSALGASNLRPAEQFSLSLRTLESSTRGSLYCDLVLMFAA